MTLIAKIPISEIKRRKTLCANDYIPSRTQDIDDIKTAERHLKAAQTRLENVQKKSGDNEMLRRRYEVKHE